jgi:hypothetical protein
VIRQAISCDICGAEKKQTNHWFVAYEQSGELRASGWNSRIRLRPGTKHLCGQICLHKLVDDFMARSIAVRAHPAADEAEETLAAAVPTLAAAVPVLGETAGEVESSARVLAPPVPALPKPPFRAPVELVTMQGRPSVRDPAAPPEEPPRFATRNRRSEAWARERERTLYAVERRREQA